MLDVAIAMIPATAYGVYQLGVKAALVLLVSILSCVLSEYVFETLMGKPVTVSDGSALVTGMILGLNMPPAIPLWMPFLGGVFAIIVVKQLYGGLGQNFMNPALAARCFLLISFAGPMTTFTYNDAVVSPTPLAAFKAGQSVDVAAMFIGKIPGTIGEVFCYCPSDWCSVFNRKKSNINPYSGCLFNYIFSVCICVRAA